MFQNKMFFFPFSISQLDEVIIKLKLITFQFCVQCLLYKNTIYYVLYEYFSIVSPYHLVLEGSLTAIPGTLDLISL